MPKVQNAKAHMEFGSSCLWLRQYFTCDFDSRLKTLDCRVCVGPKNNFGIDNNEIIIKAPPQPLTPIEILHKDMNKTEEK